MDMRQIEKDVQTVITILQAQGFRELIPEYSIVLNFLGVNPNFESDYEALLYFSGIQMGIEASKPDFIDTSDYDGDDLDEED